MTSGAKQREFAELKHRSGQWRSRIIHSRNIILRSIINFFSFKRKGVDDLSRFCPRSSIVVDFGSGQGAYSFWFSQRCECKIISIDWSFDALKLIKKENLPNIFPVCADLASLPLKSECIDTLFSIDTLGHLTDQEKSLDEILRVCRPSAKLFLHSECGDYKKRWPDSMLIRKIGYDSPAEYDGHYSLRNHVQLRFLISKRFQLINFFSPAGIIGWILGYPEKYYPAFKKAGCPCLSLVSLVFSIIKKTPFLGILLRFINITINKFELFFGIEGGGSCFAYAEKHPSSTISKFWKNRSIDIIIPTYSRSDKIEPLCRSLSSMLRENDHIYIISQCEKTEISASDNITHLHLKKPNLPAARNIGLLAGKGDLVLFLDDDVVPMDGLLDAHRKCYNNPSIGCVAGYIEDSLFFKNQNAPSIINLKTGECRQNFSFEKSQFTISVMGANMSFRKDLLINIQGFDRDYKGNAHWEDIDCAFRIQTSGHKIWFCSEAKVIHQRDPLGGCRKHTGSIYAFHVFANTSYFACKFVPIRYFFSWMYFWKYRLEYLSRIKDDCSFFKHDPAVISAAFLGTVMGIIRFIGKLKARYNIEPYISE